MGLAKIKWRIAMVGYERWQVGPTQPVTYGLGHDDGYGFSIQDQHGGPLLTITFTVKEDAVVAQAAVRAALARAVHIEKS
jgi:hypothetical protein